MKRLPFLIGSGLMLSTFTKIRFTSEIGIGELALVLAAILLSLQLFREQKINVDPLKKRLLTIIFIFILICIVSNFYNAMVDSIEIGYARDFIAFLFAMILITLILLNSHYLKLIDLSMHYFYLSVSVYIIILFFYVMVIDPVYHIDLFYDSYDTRLVGLSKNPNQLALLLLTIPVLSINHMLKSSRKAPLFPIIMLCVSLIIGFKIDSDALMLSWILSVLYAFLYRFVKFSAKQIGKTAMTFFMSGLVLAVYPYLVNLYAYFSDMFDQEGDQASTRYALWENGLKAFLYSPIVGNGTSAHSGVFKPFEGVESHNSIIDLLSMTGIAGFLIVFVLMFLILKNNYLSLPAFILFFQIVIFSNFHNILRQPLIWFFLLVLLVNHKKLMLTALKTRFHKSSRC